jgi:hypothetical protein
MEGHSSGMRGDCGCHPMYKSTKAGSKIHVWEATKMCVFSKPIQCAAQKAARMRTNADKYHMVQLKSKITHKTKKRGSR